MADYTPDAQAALQLIAEAGASFPVKRTGGTFNPATGEATGTTGELVGTVTAVLLPRWKGGTYEGMDAALKDAIVSGRAKTMLAAAADAIFPPEPGDLVTIGALVWRVVGVTVLNPDGNTPILYTMGVMH